MTHRERFLNATRGRPVDCTPVWFMRQAGRYQAVYRELRGGHTLLELCRDPKLACQVTLQPIQSFDLDAAIIFADILLPLEPMGVDFEFAKGEGPVIHQPVRTADQVRGLKPVDPEAGLGYVLEALRLVRKELPEHGLIGFCGGPFTLASYMIEGGGSRHYAHTKRMMYTEPETWHALMRHLAELLSQYLVAQHEAGADIVQLFDSWVGNLSPIDYREFVFPHVQQIFRTLKERGVPSIHFGTGTSELLTLQRDAGGDVIGADWRIELDEAWRRLGPNCRIQGNLDPLVLLGSTEFIEQRIDYILKQAGGRPGHIFNLGHGIIPETPEENVRFAVDAVHRLSRQHASIS